MSEQFTLMVGAIIVAFIAAVPATIAAINSVSAKQAASTAKDVAAVATQKIDTLSINVDGRLSLLMEKVEEAALARGRAEGEKGVRVEVARAQELAAATQAGTDAATVVAAAAVVPPGVATGPVVSAALTAVTDAIANAVTDTHEKVTDIHQAVIPPTDKGS